MKFRRGFKADCEQIAAEVRDELMLAVDEPVDMGELARHILIPVQSLAAYIKHAGHLQCEHTEEIYAKVSAFTTFRGSHRTIVYNDRHGAARHRSNLAHEIAHALLGHPPEGTSSQAQEQMWEAEAAWMGGVLMLSRPQAILVARTGLSSESAMKQFGVSPQMLRFRMNVTGAARLA